MQSQYSTTTSLSGVIPSVGKKPSRPYRILSTLLMLCLLTQNLHAHGPHADDLPDLGNSSNAALSPAQEYELGVSIMKEIQAAMVISQDIIVSEYLQEIGYRLIATNGGYQPHYVFFAVRDNSINAFALPGGFVGVNTGLILATEGESELAGVMAHEVGHVQQKHIARMYEHMGRLQLSTIAGMIASIIIATQNPQAGSGAMAATLAGGQQAMINFTRDHEKEADYVGIQTLYKANFDPMGMPAFFHRMYQDTRFYGNHVPEYLLTHPLTESRLMAAKSRAQHFPYKQVPDSLLYHLVQARIQVQSFNTAQDACAFFAKRLQRGNYRSRIGTLYGYALALIDAGEPVKAKTYLDEMLLQHPDHPLFQLAYSQAEIAAHQSQSALSRLEQSLKNHPNHYPLTFHYAQLLIRTGEPQSAIRLLKQRTLQKSSSRPELWNLLSSAYAKANQPILAHQAQAQFLKLQGDLQGALTQLKIAQKISPSLPEQRQIEAQMQEIQQKISLAKKK